MQNLVDLLRNNPYPGRGIVVGKDWVYYFIMGRSANSRNRVFVKSPDGIRTEAFDPAKIEDPSLILYHPVRRGKTGLVVSNGDQTDTIVEGLRAGLTFEEALQSREYEPDAPNYTPRISAFLPLAENKTGPFELSILKRGEDGHCLREFFRYEGCEAEEGYFLSTYAGDGNPLPAFEGEPKRVKMASPKEVWAALNADNKVSLWAWEAEKGETIFNKNEKD